MHIVSGALVLVTLHAVLGGTELDANIVTPDPVSTEDAVVGDAEFFIPFVDPVKLDVSQEPPAVLPAPENRESKKSTAPGPFTSGEEEGGSIEEPSRPHPTVASQEEKEEEARAKVKAEKERAKEEEKKKEKEVTEQEKRKDEELGEFVKKTSFGKGWDYLRLDADSAEKASTEGITDEEAISREIQKIDKAIANIDNAIKESDDDAVKAKAALSSDSESKSESESKSSSSSSSSSSSNSSSSSSEPSTAAPAPVSKEAAELELFKFKSDELSFAQHPAVPADTRRMFEGIPGDREAKIRSLGSFKLFIKRNNLGGSVTDKEGLCEPSVTCDPKFKYRSFDGTCNNLAKPNQGSIYRPYQRLLEPAYADGESLPRGVTKYSEDDGYTSTLPSPRKVSDVVFASAANESFTEDNKLTHMVMQWGQFIDHDMIATSKPAADCCSRDIRNSFQCFPISVASDDSFFSEFGKTCLDFARSSIHCKNSSFVEQFNKQTSYLDGSHVYGWDEERSLHLRGEKKGGRLAMNSQIPHFLPSKFDLRMVSNPQEDQPADLVAGDGRAESQASLTSVHNLFLNEHNRIADFLFQELKKKSSLSDEDLDELVYQETRRIVSAEIQHITYSEFLPQVIGRKGMADHGLDMEKCVYDPEADSTIINSFATAAFRFGHSMVAGIFRGETQPWRLGKFYADSIFATKDNGTGYCNELVGLSKQPCQKTDTQITVQMTQLLFCNNKTAPGNGHDIGSLNIQRGRDHGLPAYNKFREFCGLPLINSLSSTPSGINPEAWEKIKSVYKSVDDIDFYAGGLAEEPNADGVVGPTFACIIGKQFKALMDGDRFFYHHHEGPDIVPLSEGGQEEMKSRTLGALICEATPVEQISSNVFLQESSENKIKPCSEHKKMDLNKFLQDIKV